MKLMKKLISAAVSAAIILSLLLSFTACFKNLATPEVEPQPKEEIINNINAAEENNTRSFDYLADFLIEWGFPEFNKEEVANYVKKSGARVIERKGATFYAVSMSVCHICKCLLSGIDTTLTVSTMLHGEYGINDV